MLFSVPLLDKRKHQLLQSWGYSEPVNEEERLCGSPPPQEGGEGSGALLEEPQSGAQNWL